MPKKMSKKRNRPPGEWFVECKNSFSNNGLAAFLSEQGSGYDSELKSVIVLCNDGVRRPLFRILGSQVRPLLSQEKSNDVFKFRIWKRDHDSATAYPMDFIAASGGARGSKQYKSAADKLKAERAARAAGTL